jgi:hypothetical protein
MSKAATKRGGKAKAKSGTKESAPVVEALIEVELVALAKNRDPRLPALGTVLTKQRGNETHDVRVLAKGFEYRGETYRSLSKIARLITGVSWNGYAFFGLLPREQRRRA